MKYAGIDGILIDWYGSYNINDTYTLTRNSNAIIDACKKVGLEFAIIYEDRTIPNVMINTGSKDTVELAVTDMAYIMNSYMTKSNYIKIDGKPFFGFVRTVGIKENPTYTYNFWCCVLCRHIACNFV